ncbi:MAG: hypothetical protein G01um101416_964 [Microgenomates group bacterium Gr01-1014_16]|nr:MAG: hypothetical protein G01um101416_964 [Microgenomates group bacterium Gr01-1014_16]
MGATARYQVYLDPRSVGILDEASGLLPVTRSQIMREAIDAAAGRVGNLLAMFKPVNSNNYSWMDKMVGSISSGRKFKKSASERVDDIYYDK